MITTDARQCDYCGCTADDACVLDNGMPCDWLPTFDDVMLCSNPKCVAKYHATTAAHKIAAAESIYPTRHFDRIEFFVDGTPKTAGSKTAMPVMRNGRPVVRNGRPVVSMVDNAGQGKRGKAYKAWRRSVEVTARLVFRDAQPLIYPIQLTAIFFVERPKGHYGTGRNAGQLKPNAPAVPVTKPDATKMLRLVEDCLSGVVWADDNQVVDQVCRKRYAINGRTGAAIRIDPVIY